MDLLMNGLLMAATLFAGGYCWVLGRRVNNLKSLDRGLGGSIVTLTRQIELARTTLEEARTTSKDTRQDLATLVGKADAASNQLKMLIAAAPLYPPEPRFEPAPPAPAAVPVEAPAPAYVAPMAAPVVAPHVAPPLALVAERPAGKPLTLPEMAAPAQAEDVAVPGAMGPTAMNLAEVPKPRALAPIENPLRRAKGARAAGGGGAGTSEDAILEALTALAAGGR